MVTFTDGYHLFSDGVSSTKFVHDFKEYNIRVMSNSISWEFQQNCLMFDFMSSKVILVKRGILAEEADKLDVCVCLQ